MNDPVRPRRDVQEMTLTPGPVRQLMDWLGALDQYDVAGLYIAAKALAEKDLKARAFDEIDAWMMQDDCDALTKLHAIRRIRREVADRLAKLVG